MHANHPFDRAPPLWLYWENPAHAWRRPEYLDLCRQSVRKHCDRDFTVVELTPHNVYRYLPDLRADLRTAGSLAQRSHYIRLALLEKYGGAWLDADVLVFGSLMPYVRKLEAYDYVGFGCHFQDCGVDRATGAPRPATWIMVSRPHGELVTLARKRADFLLNQYPWALPRHPQAFGTDLVWACIDDLLRERAENNVRSGEAVPDRGWRYYHVGSKCVERDSQGRSFHNLRMLTNERVDPRCVGRMLVLPIRSTTPGLSHAFLDMSADQLLNHPDMLLSRFFRWSLRDETPTA